MRTGCLDINRIERLARGHKQAIALSAAEANVGAGLGQANHPDALTIGRDDLNAGTRAGPNIAVDVAANSVSGRRRCRSGNIKLNEALSISDRLAVHIPHFDLAAGAG